MLSLFGLATVLIIVLLLLYGKVTPIVGLVIVPITFAFVAGFPISEIGEFFNDGITRVINVVIMFIFAILYFGIMQNAGLFDPIINRMVSISRGNIIAVAVGTVIIAAIAHLDGSGHLPF